MPPDPLPNVCKKTEIIEERKQEQYDSLLEEWKDAAEIEVNEKNWNKIDFIDQGVTIITGEEEDTADTAGDDGTSTDDSTAEDGSSADTGTTEDGTSDGAASGDGTAE